MNKEALDYFDYEVLGDPSNAEYLEANSLFVGIRHID